MRNVSLRLVFQAGFSRRDARLPACRCARSGSRAADFHPIPYGVAGGRHPTGPRRLFRPLPRLPREMSPMRLGHSIARPGAGRRVTVFCPPAFPLADTHLGKHLRYAPCGLRISRGARVGRAAVIGGMSRSARNGPTPGLPRSLDASGRAKGAPRLASRLPGCQSARPSLWRPRHSRGPSPARA